MSLAKAAEGASGKLTVSCGVAPLGLDTELETLVSDAESALRRAKDGGRNRVEVAGS